MLERTRDIQAVRARDAQVKPEEVIQQRFAGVLGEHAVVDARFADAGQRAVIGVSGTTFQAPLVTALLADQETYRFLGAKLKQGQSVLVQVDSSGTPAAHVRGNGGIKRLDLPPEVAERVASTFAAARSWAGTLDRRGRHIVDPRAPAPGPHFFTNLLVGNRIGFAKPLQTTPKSVVDNLGRGSFRAYAAEQVLATRWDLRPEENGFPANRQCYLVENGERVFFSGQPDDGNIHDAETVHAQNHTVIRFKTKCGLEITRTIFVLPGEEGLPLATEVHSIVVRNSGEQARELRLIVTGMFGPAAPNGLWEDVVYTTVSMQGRVVRNSAGQILAISPHYHPKWTKGDERFHTTIVRQGGRVFFPTEFATSYNDFVGQGTLAHPDGLALLANRLARKGPGFFALAAPFRLEAGAEIRADNFTSLVSDKAETPKRGRMGKTAMRADDERVVEAVQRLIGRFSTEGAVDRALRANADFYERYRQHFQIRSGDQARDAFVNHNLPFQVLYQTFVSRSFDQTQKGYREIGFREIQDLFASMPFFIAMGEQRLVKELLKEWAGQIYDFGYANHNFYWTGKEPGDFSDDALWFVQAVDVYLNQSDDWGFLDERCDIAGRAGSQRTIYEAIQSVLRYSGEISIGKHGLPLLDRADWNDTLRLDPEYLNGPQKEEAYRKRREKGRSERAALETDNSESVMNAFLLKIALDATRRFAERRGDSAYAAKSGEQSARLAEVLQRDAWKGDFFARVLLNRGGRYQYLGAKGDGLSADPNVDGTYFLNSLTWSVLAGVAREEQVRVMLGVVKNHLWTPYGLKLCSPVNFAAITSRGGSAEYFPGDRENGGVFKHADMMAAVAFLKTARTVADPALAAELRDLASAVIDAVMPYRTMADPYVLAGNPRFCTQYNNSETGENIGPTLSGTASWLTLALNAAYGLEIRPEGIELDPVLPDEQRSLEIELRTQGARYEIRIEKPAGFYRSRDSEPELFVDDKPAAGRLVPHFTDGRAHRVVMRLGE